MPESTETRRKRHVLMIVENLPVPFDRRVWEEAVCLRQNGYEVTVISPTGWGHEAARERREGISIRRHRLRHVASGIPGYVTEYVSAITSQLRLAREIHKASPVDVIHASNPPDTIFLVAMMLKRHGVRFVFDQHDLCPEIYEVKFGRRGVGHRLTRLLERFSFRAADVSLATNETFRSIAIERGGMDPEDVFVVRNGPVLKRFGRVDPNPTWSRGRSHVVSYVGVMEVQDGIDTLLRIAQHVVKRRSGDVQFVIMGDGTVREDMERYAASLGLSDHVTFTGRVDEAQLMEVLSSTDVCVNPDPYNVLNDKLTAVKVLDYMAVEKPIVQFDLTEGRRSAGDASLYAAAGDEVGFASLINDLLDDPEQRGELGRTGRARIEKSLSWEHSTAVLLQAYRHLFRDEAIELTPRGRSATL